VAAQGKANPPQKSPPSKREGKPAGGAGRRKGAPGHSRTQRLAVDAEEVHAPHGCAICDRRLEAAYESRVHNARYELELVPPADGGSGLVLTMKFAQHHRSLALWERVGVRERSGARRHFIIRGGSTRPMIVRQAKHIYLETLCPCGHWNRTQPGRCGDEEAWTVALSEWHLAGPTLVAFICALTQRMRLSRAKVREFFSDWLGLSLPPRPSISASTRRHGRLSRWSSRRSSRRSGARVAGDGQRM
jgi:transposase